MKMKKFELERVKNWVLCSNRTEANVAYCNFVLTLVAKVSDNFSRSVEKQDRNDEKYSLEHDA